MKQIITEGQLEELTDEQETKLYRLGFDMKTFTIGEMIGILHLSFSGRLQLLQIFNNQLGGIDGRSFNEPERGEEWENEVDLCDTLWEAVKDVLC